MECEHMVHWGRASFIAPWSRIVRRVSVVTCVRCGARSPSAADQPPWQHRFVQSPHKSFNLTKHKSARPTCNEQRPSWQILCTPSRLLGKPRKYNRQTEAFSYLYCTSLLGEEDCELWHRITGDKNASEGLVCRTVISVMRGVFCRREKKIDDSSSTFLPARLFTSKHTQKRFP